MKTYTEADVQVLARIARLNGQCEAAIKYGINRRLPEQSPVSGRNSVIDKAILSAGVEIDPDDPGTRQQAATYSTATQVPAGAPTPDGP